MGSMYLKLAGCYTVSEATWRENPLSLQFPCAHPYPQTDFYHISLVQVKLVQAHIGIIETMGSHYPFHLYAATSIAHP